MKKLQAFLKRAQVCGFTSLTQVRVFLALADFEDETTARAIADATGIEPPMVAGVLKSLSDWTLVDLEKRHVVCEGQKRVRIFVRMSKTGRTSLDLLRMEVAR